MKMDYIRTAITIVISTVMERIRYSNALRQTLGRGIACSKPIPSIYSDERRWTKTMAGNKDIHQMIDDV
jgi:hypothetical protein